MINRRGYSPAELAILAEVQQDLAGQVQDGDEILKRLGYVGFLSRSSGRGRPARLARRVELIYYAGRAYTIGSRRTPLDRIAHEVVTRVSGEDANLADFLVDHLRRFGQRNSAVGPPRKKRAKVKNGAGI